MSAMNRVLIVSLLVVLWVASAMDYQVPFRFTGKIDKLTVKLGPNEM